MYYAEKIINGVLHWRGTPDGEWIPFTAEELTTMFFDLKARIDEANAHRPSSDNP